MKLKKGDKVIVMTGKEKGKSSTVTRVLREENKVILEGLNMMKKHIKSKKENEKGQIVSIAMPINASNVKLADKKVKAVKAIKEVKTEAKPKKVAVKKAVKKEKKAE